MKVLDTNVVIYHIKGLLKTPLAGNDFMISVLTEIEILGHPSLTPVAEAGIRSLLATMEILGISEGVKAEAIRLRRTTTLRLPDAIIAATALATGSELLTHDAGLLKIPGLASSAPPLR